MDDQQNQQLATEETTEENAVVDQTLPISDKSTVLLSLEEMIKNDIARIDQLADDLKKQRQMFSDTFENNTVFHEQEIQAKEANNVKAKTKQEILKQPQVRQTAEKMKDISIELREKKKALSDYLLEYQRMTGATEIEDHKGQYRTIAVNANLIKQNKK